MIEKGSYVLIKSLKNHPVAKVKTVFKENSKYSVNLGGKPYLVEFDEVLPVAILPFNPTKELGTKQQSLLVYIETCAVDYGGLVDSKRVNNDEISLLEQWHEEKYINLEFIEPTTETRSSCKDIFIELSEEAWNDAHRYRKERYLRMRKGLVKKKAEEAWREERDHDPKEKSILLSFREGGYFLLSVKDSYHYFSVNEHFRFRNYDLEILEGMDFWDLTSNELRYLFELSTFVKTE